MRLLWPAGQAAKGRYTLVAAKMGTPTDPTYSRTVVKGGVESGEAITVTI